VLSYGRERLNPTETQNSQTAITLIEYGSIEIALRADVYAILHSRYAKQVEIAHTGREGVYKLTARDYVGRISLPGGGLLVIRPKVGVGNLFYMLCADAALADFHPPPTGLQEDREIVPFVLAALLSAAEKAVAGGLYRDYSRREERLPYVRGRILLGEQARHGWLHHKHSCSYADHTADTPENRVLAATLRLMPALLKGHPEEVHLAARARGLCTFFNDVTPIQRAEAVALLPRLRVHRLNATYGPALALCGLVLRGLTLNEQAGVHPYASFLVQMPRLFESFLTKRLSRLLPQYGLRVVAQRHDYLDEERKVGIRPDILVFAGRERDPRLVLDAKYKRSDGPDADPNRDLYQVNAYLDRYSLQSGVLVYPRFEGEQGSQVGMRGTLKRLHVLTLNLGAATPAMLDEECARLAQKIAHLATNQANSG
jgi:5-methylcytosine-specific restriction enzyme subunit McrC